MNATKHTDPADKDWRKELRAAADTAQARREEVVGQRIAESLALRRIGDQHIAEKIATKTGAHDEF